MSRSVFITGAGRRIGRGLALHFAAKGWKVAVHYGSSRDRAEATLRDVQERGAEGILVQADVRNRPAIQEAVRKAASAFGGLDVLINNAGVYPPAIPLENLEEETWRWVLETNLYGEFFAAQAVAGIMKEQPEGGRIVNLSSLGAYQIWKDRIPYHVSKAGVVQLTRVLARALAPKVMVNSVAPGVINLPDDPADGALIPADRIPMARYGSIDDIFNAVWFFAQAGTYITGQTLLVDGGLSVTQAAGEQQ